MSRRSARKILLVAVTALLVGCSSPEAGPQSVVEPTPELSLALVQRSGGAPSVTVLEPASGATVSSPFRVRIAADNFELAPAGRTRDGEGHWHVMSGTGCLEPGTVIPKDDSHFHVGSGADTAELNLAPGDHELCVQIGDGFHVAVAITETFTVTVTK